MKSKKSSGSLRMKPYWSWIVYSAVVLIMALMQMSPRCFPIIAYARPTPLILLVICVAMLEGPLIGSVMGVVAGLLWNLYSTRVFGYYGLMLMAIGLIIGLLVQWLLRANFWSAMLLCTGGVAVYTLLDWAFSYVLFLHDEMTAVLLHVYLPNALYTVLLSPLMYWLVLAVARFLRRKREN